MTNFFEFYTLPENLVIDAENLKKLFYEKSRSLHPDFFVNDDETAKETSLTDSTLNNEAYKTLLHPVSRLQHMLLLKGIITDEDKTALPPDFLMEMMDLNEEIEMADTNESKQKLNTGISELIDGNEKEMQRLFASHDEASEAHKTDILKQLAVIWLKNKYFLRLKQSVSTFASPE